MGGRRMKLILLTFLLIFASCAKHEDKETVNDTLSVQAKGDFYISEIRKDPMGSVTTAKCDTLTFYSLASAFGGDLDLGGFEYVDGEWHRDTHTCYPEDSRSEISFDGLIGVLHYAWSKQDFALLDRLDRYGKRHDYVYGDGDRSLTFNPQIGVLIGEMKGEQKLVSNLTLDGSHRPHILTIGIWLRGRYNGNLTTLELETLKGFTEIPLAKALVHRYSDGDQSETIALMEDESIFPSDRVPMDTAFGWGSSRLSVYYIMLLGVIHGQ